MEIKRFTEEYIDKAAQIARDNYDEERRAVAELPELAQLPDLAYFAKNGLGSEKGQNKIQ